MKTKKSIKLSIYLLKSNSTPESSLKETHQSKLEPHKYRKNLKIAVSKNRKTPDWVNYLKMSIQVSNASAVLFIKNKSNWFAICFGYGHNMLETNHLVSDFGLITVLNILDGNKIKSSDIFSPSDHSKQRRTQTVQDSSLQGHDIDKFSHILKKITGKTLDKYKDLSKNITGSYESIQINTVKSLDELEELLNQIYQIYQKKDYKNNFPEVLYINPVRDTTMTTNLFNNLFTEMQMESFNVSLEVPDLIDFQDINKFRFNLKDRKKHFIQDISISGLYSIISQSEKEINKENMEKWELCLVDINGNDKNSFKLLKCIVFDCQLKGKNYHFSNGKWYELDNKISSHLNKCIDSLKTDKICGKSLPDYNHANEAEYNQCLADKLQAILLDRECIQISKYDKIEPCDVFFSKDEKNIFIHVKRKHTGSSGLSHLFQQGNNSLALLKDKDDQFIQGMKKKVKDFNPELKNEIYYVIISNNQSIPLFSKISLFRSIKEIQSKQAKVFWLLEQDQNLIRKKKEMQKKKTDQSSGSNTNWKESPSPSPM